MSKDEQRIVNDSELTAAVGGGGTIEKKSNYYYIIESAIRHGESEDAMSSWRHYLAKLSDPEKQELREMFFSKFGFYIDQKASWDSVGIKA